MLQSIVERFSAMGSGAKTSEDRAIQRQFMKHVGYRR